MPSATEILFQAILWTTLGVLMFVWLEGLWLFWKDRRRK